jgi:hypothetical protein
MRVLEARFDFHGDSLHAPIVVGHLVWETDEPGADPAVLPSASFLSAGWPSTILAKLEYLIQITRPNSFALLHLFGNRLWSFVEVSPRDGELGQGCAS